MGLAELQRCFQDYLLGCDASMPRHVDGGPAGLDIYSRGYRLRLIEALGNDFPGLKALLGEDDFAHLALEYVAGYPSRHYSLRWLGRGLADHLSQGNNRLAADMARFDWAVALAFDAPDEGTAGLPDLLSLPPEAWERFTLRFAAGVSFIVAAAQTGDLRRALLRDGAASRPLPGLPVSWLVWRSGEEVQYRALAEDEAAGFAAMQSGGSFARMCESLARDCLETDPARRGAEILQDWLLRGLVAAIIP
jgi:hypothetical protein